MDKEVFDLEAALGRMEGDQDLLEEMIDIFLSDYPNQVNEIRAAIDRKDAEELVNAAHALKGAVGNFGAKRVFELAQSLEKSAKDSNCEDWLNSFQNLEQELAKLDPALRSILS